MGEPEPTRWRGVRFAAAMTLCALLLGAASAGCAPTNTDEVGSPTVDGYPDQSPDGYPAPQVMAEVTLPDGSVGTLPQPSVPAVAVPEIAEPDAGGASAQPPGTTVVRPTDDRAVQQLSDAAAIAASSRALGLLRFDWRAILPGWQIRFLPGRSGLRGATYPDRRVIEIYVRSSDTPVELAHVVAHELGHAVDVSRLDDADRAVWKTARGIGAGVAWFPNGSAVPDYSTPAGDWAESFAHWHVGSGWFSKLGPPPDAGQVALMARLAGLG